MNLCGYIIQNIVPKKSQIDGLVQERRNTIANALELHLSCTHYPIEMKSRHLFSKEIVQLLG